MRARVAIGALLSTVVVVLAVNGVADARPYAPLDRPGPRLSVPRAALRASLACSPGYARQARPPVLLVPGTNLDPGVNYGWNYERAFAATRRPYCAVTVPAHSLGDIQIAAEYIVSALRTMARAAHRRVDVLGFSQGGMSPRWALRFWPDTRRLVADLVAIDPSNHGTLDAAGLCSARSCAPADWQQASNAHFIAALNSRAETFAGIDYTVIYSRLDEIVVPNLDDSGSSSLHTGHGRIANIRVQDICPADPSEHLAMGTTDPVAYALAVDAFSHPGPAVAARVSPGICSAPLQPGVDPLSFPANEGAYLAAIAQAQATAPQTGTEPPLRGYVFR